MAVCGTAQAQQAQKVGVVSSAKQTTKQVVSSGKRDARAIVRADKFRAEQGGNRSAAARTQTMGAGPQQMDSGDAGRRARMDAAYSNWRARQGSR